MSTSQPLDLEKASLLDSDDAVDSTTQTSFLASTSPPSTESGKKWFGTKDVILWLAIPCLAMFLLLDKRELRGLEKDELSSVSSSPPISLPSKNNHLLLLNHRPFSFTLPPSPYIPPYMPNPPRPDDPRFFQSSSQTFLLPLDSELTFLRVFGEGTSGQVFVRAAEKGKGEGDEMEGVKVDLRATWRDRVDWEDEEWGTRMFEKGVEGGDVEGEAEGERGVLLEVKPGIQPRRTSDHPPSEDEKPWEEGSQGLSWEIIITFPSPNYRGKGLEVYQDQGKNSFGIRFDNLNGASFETIDVTGGLGPISFHSLQTNHLSITSDIGSIWGTLLIGSSFELNAHRLGSVNVTVLPLPPSSSSIDYPSPTTRSITIRSGTLDSSYGGDIELHLPKGTFEGVFDLKTRVGTMEVDIVTEDDQVVEAKGGKWGDGVPTRGWEVLGSLRKKGGGGAEGRIEIETRSGLVTLKID